MRLAPVPLYYGRDPAQAIERSAESCRTTHGATTGVDACRYMGGLIVGALAGASKADFCSVRFAPLAGGYWTSRSPVPARSMPSPPARSRRSHRPRSGATATSSDLLEAALWAFQHARLVRGRLPCSAVNLGDDADTTGAVYGQLAGAFYGAEAIPAAWRRSSPCGRLLKRWPVSFSRCLTPKA